jgi:archaemetzincin
MRFPIIFILPLLLLLQACGPDGAGPFVSSPKLADCTVLIQPYEESIPETVAFVAAGIADTFGVVVKILSEKKLPASAWYLPTKRYKADTILQYLKPLSANNFTYVIGITGKDIATNKNGNPYWGIMGLGFCPGRCCVVSDYRLHKYPQTQRQLNTRLLKVALHELGHNFGLQHCPNQNCLMVDAQGKDKIDGEKAFCAACRKKLSLSEKKVAEKF